MQCNVVDGKRMSRTGDVDFSVVCAGLPSVTWATYSTVGTGHQRGSYQNITAKVTFGTCLAQSQDPH